MTNAYDEIAYPSGVFRQTHPGRLATQATLLGLTPPPPDDCRVLEIGAGDGSNLIPMALTLPGARLVGFDLAAAPVARGNALVAALDLENSRLIQGDLCEIDLGSEPFDYIIAHGVYSWVADQARDALMRLIRRYLAPRGVAYVSFNTLPGGYPRQVVRAALLFATRGVAGRTARVEAAMARLAAWPDPPDGEDAFRVAVAREARRMAECAIGTLAHDELSDAYHPVYLSDFANHCAENDLQPLCEAAPTELAFWRAPDGIAEASVFDPVAAAQAADFAATRFFRQTLVVGAETTIPRRPTAEAIGALHVASGARRDSGGRFTFDGGAIDLHDRTLAEVLDTLAGLWPGSAPVAGLVDDGDRRLALATLHGVGAVELQSSAPVFVTVAGERPTVSPLARLQAGRGESRLTTLRHTVTEVDDAFSRGFIAGLDGRRDRAMIAGDLATTLGLTLDAASTHLNTLLDLIGRQALLAA